MPSKTKAELQSLPGEPIEYVAVDKVFVAVGGLRGWKERGLSAVDSTHPGGTPEISRSGPARE